MSLRTEAIHLNLLQPQGSIFVLSGEDLTLPVAETRALLQTYSNGSAFVIENRRVILSNISDNAVVEKIANRGAYCRFGGIIVGRSEKIELTPRILDIADELSNRKFAVCSYSIDKSACGELGHLIKSKTDASVDLENPDCLFDIEKVGSEFIVGYSETGYKRFSWKARRPRARRFFLPSAIYPKLARALVNLSRVKEGEIFLDSFCGTGSLLIESSLMGMRSVGVDLKRWIARGALVNMRQFQLDCGVILRADSSSTLPLRTIDGVSTDIPYGRASSTLGKSSEQILDGFMNSVAGILPWGRYCVAMHPDSIKVKDNAKFEFVEEHFLYVHRSLTRAVTIFKRK